MFVNPHTGDFHFRGKVITDPDVVAELSSHIGKADDEADVWLPARMAPFMREALDGYERGRQGPGQRSFAELLAGSSSSVIRFEMRDSYDEAEKGLAEWRATGDIGAYDWGDHHDLPSICLRGASFGTHTGCPGLSSCRYGTSCPGRGRQSL